MEIRGDMDGLKSLLGISQPAPNQVQGGKGPAVRDGGPLSADTATLSSAGSVVAQEAADGGVRMEKVAAVQAALAAGTYDVPASAVASRVVDAMLGTGR
jgi:negative regulator of flagellin synthesis FlgM